MARVGRGRPASSSLRGAGISARAGALTGSAGGSGTLSVAPVLNLVSDPTFEQASNAWGTSGFSLVSGAINAGGGPSSFVGSFVATAVDQGLNYAPTGITNFLAGVRYYAQVKVRNGGGETTTVELVLGSASDDFASATVATSASQQTLSVSWVPQVDRSATNHGLAIRAKASSTFGLFEIDDAIIATADGFWSGWRVGGKGAAKAITGSSGSSATLTAGRAAVGTVTGSAGGSGTLTTRKGALRAVTGSSGGTLTATTTGAHAGTLAASAGGSGTFTASALGSTLLLPPAGLFGGGGRVGRSHPAAGIVSRGVGASYSIFARTGTVAGSVGGSGTLAGAKGGVGAATAPAGGTAALTIAKGARSAITGSSGGTATISAAATPQTGGIAATFLMGGGGRMGRSHPAMGIMPHGNVPLAASNPDARTGTLAASGGGSGTFSARKGGISTTPTAIPAPPPVFVAILAVSGVRSSAGGSFTYSYTRSAGQVGSVTGSAGGSGTFTATKKVAGAVAASAGGTGALSVRKGGRGAITGTAGGSFTYSALTFEARNGSLAASGGGTGTFRGSKQAHVNLTATSGGSLTPTARKGARVAVTGTTGGSLTYSYTRGGLAAIGTLTGTGGGTGTFVTRKNVTLVAITTSAGGGAAVVHAKGATGRIVSSAGGTGRFTRATATATIYEGHVNPRHRREGRVARDELHGRPLILRR